jgi:uncharacterized SAM-binding protein YcdF (DUF218 family)
MEILFIIKKIISSLIMPLSLGLFFFALGLYFLFKRKLQKAKIYLSIAIIWIIIISHSAFANFLANSLENEYQPLKNIPKDVKLIVFIGGDKENRGWEVLRLYHNIDDAKIITSGYEGRGTIPEAIKTANMLESIGIKNEDIFIHKKPKDTIEEARNIKTILKERRFILVTSAYHMKRAMLIFKHENLNPIPAPTDYLIQEQDSIISLPDAYNLNKTEKIWHEYIGIAWLQIINFLVNFINQ